MSSPSERGEAVQTYLRSMRELVAAQRDVMLGYLGATVTPSRVSLAPLETVQLGTPGRPASAPAPSRANGSTNGSTNVSSLGSLGDAQAVSTPSEALRGEALMEAVLGIVSERTGYPAEMLEPDLDLEADLSIDSIKRMEILAELAERVELPGADDGELDESVVEELARLKTLREVVAWIDDHPASSPAAESEAA